MKASVFAKLEPEETNMAHNVRADGTTDEVKPANGKFDWNWGSTG